MYHYFKKILQIFPEIMSILDDIPPFKSYLIVAKIGCIYNAVRASFQPFVSNKRWNVHPSVELKTLKVLEVVSKCSAFQIFRFWTFKLYIVVDNEKHITERCRATKWELVKAGIDSQSSSWIHWVSTKLFIIPTFISNNYVTWEIWCVLSRLGI